LIQATGGLAARSARPHLHRAPNLALIADRDGIVAEAKPSPLSSLLLASVIARSACGRGQFAIPQAQPRRLSL
jgi:hypothetical protein